MSNTFKMITTRGELPKNLKELIKRTGSKARMVSIEFQAGAARRRASWSFDKSASMGPIIGRTDTITWGSDGEHHRAPVAVRQRLSGARGDGHRSARPRDGQRAALLQRRPHARRPRPPGPPTRPRPPRPPTRTRRCSRSWVSSEVDLRPRHAVRCRGCRRTTHHEVHMLTKKRGRHCDRCKVDLTARPTTVNGRARVRMPPHVVVTVTRHGTTGLGDHPTVSVRPIHLCVPCSPVVAALEDLLRGGEPK